MNSSWSDELRALDRVAPSRDLWADALNRAASSRPHASRRARGLNWTRSQRQRTVVLAAGLAIAGLAATGLIVLGTFSASREYAVTTNPDGTVTITLRQFSALPALNRELARDGLPLKAVPATPNCRFNPNHGLPSQPRGSGLAPTDTITIGTSELTSEGAIGVIGVSPAATPGRLLMMAVGTPTPGPSCINTAAFGTP